MPKITFITEDDNRYEVTVDPGLSILDAARQIDAPLEGACEGSLACSTCHVILSQEDFDKLPPAEEAEEDMLDLAFGLTKTSRLGCQIIVTNDMVVNIPAVTRNAKF